MNARVRNLKQMLLFEIQPHKSSEQVNQTEQIQVKVPPKSKPRKTQSEICTHKSIIYSYFKEIKNFKKHQSNDSSSVASDGNHSQIIPQIGSEMKYNQIDLRQKSNEAVTQRMIFEHDYLQKYLVREKKQSDTEFIDLKEQMIRLIQKTQICYFTIILTSMNQLIDTFISSTLILFKDFDYSLCYLKEIIINFEKLRADYIQKLKNNDKAQSLAQIQINILKRVFGQIRFILTRFGRVINIYDHYEQLYKKRQLQFNFNPDIQRVQKQDFNFGEFQNMKQSNSQFFDLRSPLKNQISSNSNKQYGSNKIFNTLSLKEKQQVFDKFMKDLTKRWKEEYEEERSLNIPLIICRLCNNQFYADMESNHSRLCIESIKQGKEQHLLNQKFLDLSSAILQSQILLEKSTQAFTPRITYRPRLTNNETPQATMRSVFNPLVSNQTSFCSNKTGEEVGNKNLINNESSSNISSGNVQTHTTSSTHQKSRFFQQEQVKQVEESKQAFTDFAEDKESKSTIAKANIPKLQMQKISNLEQKEVVDPQQTLFKYSNQTSAPVSQQLFNKFGQKSQQPEIKSISNTKNALRDFEKGLNSARKEPAAQEDKLTNREIIITGEAPREINSSINVSNSIQHSMSLQNMDSVKLKQIKPKKSSILAIASIRNDLITSEKKLQEQIPLQTAQTARITNPPAMDQDKHEENKLNPKDQAVSFVLKSQSDPLQVAIKKHEEVIKPTIREQNKNQKIDQIAIPKSPYLTHFKSFGEILNSKLEKEKQKKSDMNLSSAIPSIQNSRKNSIQSVRSPYLDLQSKQFTKEQRQAHLKQLKDHVLSQINKDTNKSSKKKGTYSLLTENAFTINIKNQKEKVLLNIDNLRKSVKLKKRPNPLERNMLKITKMELGADILSNNINIPSHDNKQNMVGLKPSAKLNTLQSIEENLEYENNKTAKTLIKFQKEENSDGKVQQVQQRMMDVKQHNLSSMSPLIAFRPLNNFGDKSKGSTPLLGTPLFQSNVSFYSNRKNTMNNADLSPLEDKDDIYQMVQLLKNSQKEKDILVNLQLLAKEAFQLLTQYKSYTKQRIILQKYLDTLKEIIFDETLSQQTTQLIEQFKSLLEMKLNALDMLIQNETDCLKTLPPQIVKQKIEEDKLNSEKMKKYDFTNSSSQDDSFPQSKSRHFFPQESGLIALPKVERRISQIFQNLQSNLDNSPIVRQANAQKLKNFDNSGSPCSLMSSENHTSFSSNQQLFSTPLITSKGMTQTQKSDLSKIVMPPNLQSLTQMPQMLQLTQNNQATKEEKLNKTPKKLDAIEEVNEYKQIMRPIAIKGKSQFEKMKSNEPEEDEQCISNVSSEDESLSGDSTDEIQLIRDNMNHKETHPFISFKSPRPQFKIQKAEKEKLLKSQKSIKNLLKENHKKQSGRYLKQDEQQLKTIIDNSYINNEDCKDCDFLDKLDGCLSDLVVGNNYDQELEVDDRDYFSDFHDQLFVECLFGDQELFDQFLLKGKYNERESPKVHSSKQNCDLYVDNQLYMKDVDFGKNPNNSSDEILTMPLIRFNSHPNLPSQLECCQIDQNTQQKEITINDFILLKTLSSGAYGKVILSRKKNTQDLFAIKVLEKEKMIQKNVTDYVLNEGHILKTVNNEFIVRGVYIFQSRKYLYMVMEFMKGGDFSNLLENIMFEEEQSKYYLAQIVLALEYLHSNNIIHRDLKPDNILLDERGHIKLTDFGLSEAGLLKIKEKVTSKTKVKLTSTDSINHDLEKEIQNTLGCENKMKIKQEEEAKEGFCLTRINSIPKNQMRQEKPEQKQRALGTADYMAPEVILGKEHSFALDFWALGVIVYEFLVGCKPFTGNDATEVFSKIIAKNIQYPAVGTEEGQISQEGKDFIDKLLNLDPKQRLGAGPNGFDEIKNHVFFKNIDWSNIMKDKAVPFMPKGRDIDTVYFPKANEKDEDLQQILNDQKGTEKQDQDQFNNFDAVCYPTLQSINEKEAKKAMHRQKLKKEKQSPSLEMQRFNQDSIIFDLSSNMTLLDDFLLNEQEEYNENRQQ